MTTATYIPDEDVFDLHTPCIEAVKWWVGSLVCFLSFSQFLIPVSKKQKNKKNKKQKQKQTEFCYYYYYYDLDCR